jgi:hypothetical protein
MGWLRGRKRSDADREAKRQAKLGKALSEAHRASIRAGILRWHAERKDRKEEEGRGG